MRWWPPNDLHCATEHCIHMAVACLMEDILFISESRIRIKCRTDVKYVCHHLSPKVRDPKLARFLTILTKLLSAAQSQRQPVSPDCPSHTPAQACPHIQFAAHSTMDTNSCLSIHMVLEAALCTLGGRCNYDSKHANGER